MGVKQSRVDLKRILFCAFLVAIVAAFLCAGSAPKPDLTNPVSHKLSDFVPKIMSTCACGNAHKGNTGQGSSAEAGWHLANSISYENMTVFPVIAGHDSDTSAFATLDEALASGDAIVTEQGSYLRRTRNSGARPVSGAQVNELVLVNRGKRPLLLLAGEVVSGGKQDRIIGKDRIVPVGAEPLPLDVFCVEHGRWTGGSDKFAAAKTIVKPSVREEAAFNQDQQKVWAAVRGENEPQTGNGRGVSAGAASGSVGSTSQTVTVTEAAPALSTSQVQSVIVTEATSQSYKKIYESDRVAPRVESFAREIEKRFNRARKDMKGERVVGVIVAYGGEVAWGDAFASSELFEAYWPKLLRSYVVEALTRPTTRENASFDDARDFLRPASGHVREESEPGIYRWSERTEGNESEIELEALRPKEMLLHWMKATMR
jgi:ARG/rhodanese/phosphatase superfamily protein